MPSAQRGLGHRRCLSAHALAVAGDVPAAYAREVPADPWRASRSTGQSTARGKTPARRRDGPAQRGWVKGQRQQKHAHRHVRAWVRAPSRTRTRHATRTRRLMP
jgi:hypothetical protein